MIVYFVGFLGVATSGPIVDATYLMYYMTYALMLGIIASLMKKNKQLALMILATLMGSG